MEDVPALLSHCFGPKCVSSEFECLLCSTKTSLQPFFFPLCPQTSACVFCPVDAFKAYLTTVMALQYLEQPDYSALKAGLSAALLQLGGTAEQPLTF